MIIGFAAALRSLETFLIGERLGRDHEVGGVVESCFLVVGMLRHLKLLQNLRTLDCP